MPVAIPAVLTALLMVAIEELDEVQFTNAVRFCVSPFVKVPIAVNGAEYPAGIVLVAGLIWIELNVDDSTNTLAVAAIDPSWAVIVTTPADCPLTSPLGLTTATLLLEDVHVHNGLIHSTVPSVKVP
jgi:hypothetical protein